MKTHQMIEGGATTSVVKRRRRHNPVFQRERGCAVCGADEYIAAKYPICGGRPLFILKPSTRTQRRRRWGGLHRQPWNRG